MNAGALRPTTAHEGPIYEDVKLSNDSDFVGVIAYSTVVRMGTAKTKSRSSAKICNARTLFLRCGKLLRSKIFRC